MTKGKILVIDDEIAVRRFLARILQDYQVQVAASGREGLEWASRGHFDVALVDIKLPDLDGMEVLRALQERHEDLKTLIITAYPALGTAIQAVQLGAFDYLVKPLGNERVLISVENALAARHLALTNRELLRDLQRANVELERRVEERTAELAKANEELRVEIAERKRAEEALCRSLEDTARGQRLLLALSQAAQAVQRARTPEEVYHTVGDEVARLGYHATIFTLTDDGMHLSIPYMTFEPALRRAAGKLTGLSAHDYHLPLVPGGLPQQIIAEGGTVFAERIAEQVAGAQIEPVRSLASQLAALLGIERGILSRLRVGGETVGLLMVTGANLTEADVPAVTTFANQAAIALENARLLERVQAARERLRCLTRQVVSAQEEERHRLSRELHDEAGQALTALKIHLDLMQSDLPVEAGPLRHRLGEAVTLTETTMAQLRSLAHDLRPGALDTVGLNYTLEGFCHDFALRTQLSIHYTGAELPALSKAADICLYRCLQEALTNVARHAHANQVNVALRCDAETVRLSVEDDGQGFEVQAGLAAGIGLLGMRERLELVGGQLEIVSRPGQGARLTAWIPLEQPHLERRETSDSHRPR